jgi:EAL domain-containing protein (putative c-di-GMP-specific phosphodiesterase class I)/FixJ family two-component response regulator
MGSSPDCRNNGKTGALLAYVLDDEVQIGDFVCAVLCASGCVAKQFGDTQSFLAAVKVHDPDLTIVDLALGHSDAVEVIRLLETIKYRGRVLLISGRDEGTLAEIRQIGERRGLVMLPPLKKPFRAEDLKNRVKNLLARAEPPVAKERRKEIGKADQFAMAPGECTRVDLEEALRNNWLELWYQPKIDLRSLSICGGEALLRANHPQLGIVGPAALLPPTGHPSYQPLSRFVMQRALVDWLRLADQDNPIKLSVNVPVSVALVPDFIAAVRADLPSDPRFPGLVIEITEDEIIEDRHWVREVATQLKLYNVSLSIDDFGSAYSSLSRLRDLPFSELKLDRSFVSGCSSDRLKHGVCRTVVDLARNVGASVCAEGVEEPDDLHALIEMGCDSAQGFLFARPMPVEQFAALLQRGEQVLPLQHLVRSGKTSSFRRAPGRRRR